MGFARCDLVRRCCICVAFTLALTTFCASAAAPQTDADKRKQAEQQMRADVLAGRKLPPITPIPAPPAPNAILLYPDAKIEGLDEQWENYAGGPIVRNVVRPTLTPFLPDPAKANGAAVIIAPGGAFMYLGMEGEGYKFAQWLAERGVVVFVLKYRIRPTSRDPQEFLANMFAMLRKVASDRAQDKPPTDADIPGVPAAALEDAQTAVRLVRSRAGEWHVDGARIGFIGFSAGAFLSLRAGLVSDPAARPDFIATMYGPTNIAEVPAYAPPLFLAAALDDPLFAVGTGDLMAAWSRAKRPIEAHFYEHGGHGFAKGTTSEFWNEQFYAWMDRRGLLKAAK
jgi:acetyl esterase/lipase